MSEAVTEKPEVARPSKSPRADALKKELETRRDAIQAKLAVHRATYDRLVNDPALIEARKQIKALSAELFPVLNELAALARAGGSKTLKAEAGSYSAG